MEKMVNSVPKFVSDGDLFLVNYGEDKKVMKVVRENDFCLNPRTDYEGNLGTMVCFHSRYDLGDEHDYDEPREFLEEMVRKNISCETILRWVQEGKTNCKLQKNREGEYELFAPYEIHTVLGIGDKDELLVGAFSEDALGTDMFTEYVLPELGMTVMSEMLAEEAGFASLPLFLYDHSGITMNTTGFSCPWDSGRVGWIYTTAENYRNITGKEPVEGWKADAEEQMTAEVKAYDHYLCGDCYSFEVYEPVYDEDGDLVSDSDDYETLYCEECVGGFLGDEYETCGILDEFEVLEYLS